MDVNTLREDHRHQLEVESAISPDVIEARGYYSASKPAEVPDVFSERQRRRRGMVIPLHSPDGEMVSYQLRPDYPAKGGPKYLNPTGSRIIADVHPMMRDKLADVREPLLITEGPKTADAVTSQGRCTIMLVGVYGFAVPHTKSQELLPCFEHVPLDGRLVYVGYDADACTNPNVQEALRRLVAALEARGATVRVLYPPVVNGDPKTGLDDYLAAGGNLAALLSSAEPYRPVNVRKERLTKYEELSRLVSGLWEASAAMPTERQGQCTDLATFRELIKTAEVRGKINGEGVEVSPPLRTLAQAVGVSAPAQSKSLKRLEERG